MNQQIGPDTDAHKGSAHYSPKYRCGVSNFGIFSQILSAEPMLVKSVWKNYKSNNISWKFYLIFVEMIRKEKIREIMGKNKNKKEEKQSLSVRMTQT